MADVAIVFVGNTNTLELNGLTDHSGAFLNDATVTASLKDSAGELVTGGEGWPQNMIYVPGSDGNYTLGLSHLLGLVNGKFYKAIINADGSSDHMERWGKWEFTVQAKTRTS